MVDILLDTSFLIEFSSKPVSGLDETEAKYGKIRFVVMEAVMQELRKLVSGSAGKRTRKAKMALDFASKQVIFDYNKGASVDDKLFNYASQYPSAIATLDRKLAQKLRNSGLPILTLSKNRIKAEGVFTQAKPS